MSDEWPFEYKAILSASLSEALWEVGMELLVLLWMAVIAA